MNQRTTFQIIARPLACAVFALVACIGCTGGDENGGDADADARRAPIQHSSSRIVATSTAPTTSPFRLAAVTQEKKDSTRLEPPEGNWGHLTGRFVYDGKPPQADQIVVTKDAQYCGKQALFDESLVVDNQMVANVFVSLSLRTGQMIDAHPSYKKDEDKQLVLDNRFCRFEPHCFVLRTTQTLSVKNSDEVGHNANLKHPRQQWNLSIPVGGSIEKQVDVAYRYPVPVDCNSHPWMNAHIMVRDDPYAAVSKENGEFVIANLPAGVHEFAFWHERQGNLGGVDVNIGETDRRGRIKIKIEPGKIIDLKDIKVPAAKLVEG